MPTKLPVERKYKIRSGPAPDYSLFADTPDAFIACDKDWRFVYANKEAEHLTGKTKEELLGNILWETFPECVGATMYYEFQRAMADKVPTSFEDSSFSQDYWLKVWAKPNACGLLIFLRDITRQKQAEKALLESEERFHLTFEQAAVGVGHMAIDGRWLRVNQRLCSILGYSRNELFLRTAQTLTYPDDLADEMKLMRKLLAGEIATYTKQKRYIHKYGHPVWTSLTMSLVTPPSGVSRYLLAFIEDITMRRAGEEQLRHQLVLNNSLTNNVVESLFMLDIAGRVTFCNPSAEQLFGWTADEMMGRVLHDVIHHTRPDGRPYPVRECPQNSVFNTGDTLLGREDSFIHKDGRFIAVICSTAPIIDPSGMVTGAVLVIHDNTERKRAERALRESEEKYRHIVDTTFEGVWSLDQAGKTTYVNDRMAEMLGHSTEEMLAFSAQDFVFESDIAEAKQNFADQLFSETRKKEFRLKRKDGSELFCLTSASPFGEEGEARGVTAMVSDITELKKAQAKLKLAFDREHRIAETLQRSLLVMPHRDAFAGLTVESLYAAAWDEAQVGGDFCDAFPLNGGKIALVLGDVAGKGLAAAARTAEIKFALRAFMREDIYPASAITRLNEFLCEAQRLDDQTDDTIVCLSLTIIDPKSGTIQTSVAGAESPLVIRVSGEIEEASSWGLPLGATEGAEYSTTTLTLEVGDIVLMVTDGITEARNNGAFFGFDGLKDFVAQSAHLSSLKEMEQALLDKARQFAGGRLQDDACLIFARRTAMD